jgi:hypothetical protein
LNKGSPTDASFAREAMSVRASLGTCLIAATLLSAAASANGQDPQDHPSIARATAVAVEVDSCVRYVAQQAMVVSCALEPQVLSDHGMTAGEAYDAQGNPIDRLGNVVAVPEARGQSAREVFAGDRPTLR